MTPLDTFKVSNTTSCIEASSSFTTLREIEPLSNCSEDYVKDTTYLSPDHRPFITPFGHIGVGLQHMKEDYNIVHLHGVNEPVAVRQKDVDISYALDGPIYVSVVKSLPRVLVSVHDLCS